MLVQNLSNTGRYFSFGCLIMLLNTAHAQDIKLFTTKDYDLQGPVKNCLVLTNYGREEFEFNRKGFLTKSVTRFNDKDYSITYYKYTNGNLTERRDEVYRDGNFDENSSMAHFFTIDTLEGTKINEEIVSYNKDLIDQYEYIYDEEGRLKRIMRSSPEGVDETRIEYSQEKGEATTSYFLNEVLLKTVRTSVKKAKDGSEHRVELTKEFIKGVPDKATEMVYNAVDDKLTEVDYDYSETEKSFVATTKIIYEYGEKGILSKVKTQTGGQTEIRNYIFQFDDAGNWIKQIITPENSYTTRRISYYEPVNETDGGNQQ